MINARTLVILSVVVCFALSPSAVAGDKKISKKDVPPAVLQSFEKAYPKAVIKGLAIEKENGKTFYEIESVDGKLSRDLLYLADGSVFEIEEGVAVADLPATVKAAIAKEHPQGKISKCEKTTHGSDVVYDCQVSFGKTKYSMAVAPDGKVIKNQKAGSPKQAKEAEEEKEEKEEKED